MAYKNIIFQIDNEIATLTFNRPEVLNALNAASLKEFSHPRDSVILHALNKLILTLQSRLIHK